MAAHDCYAQAATVRCRTDGAVDRRRLHQLSAEITVLGEQRSVILFHEGEVERLPLCNALCHRDAAPSPGPPRHRGKFTLESAATFGWILVWPVSLRQRCDHLHPPGLTQV